jgi:hypothetical protein
MWLQKLALPSSTARGRLWVRRQVIIDVIDVFNLNTASFCEDADDAVQSIAWCEESLRQENIPSSSSSVPSLWSSLFRLYLLKFYKSWGVKYGRRNSDHTSGSIFMLLVFFYFPLSYEYDDFSPVPFLPSPILLFFPYVTYVFCSVYAFRSLSSLFPFRSLHSVSARETSWLFDWWVLKKGWSVELVLSFSSLSVSCNTLLFVFIFFLVFYISLYLFSVYSLPFSAFCCFVKFLSCFLIVLCLFCIYFSNICRVQLPLPFVLFIGSVAL